MCVLYDKHGRKTWTLPSADLQCQKAFMYHQSHITQLHSKLWRKTPMTDLLMTARDRSCISSSMKWWELWKAAAVSFTCSTASMWLFTSLSSRACLFSRWLALARSFPWSSDCNCSSTLSIHTSSSFRVCLNSCAYRNKTRVLTLCDNCHWSLPATHVQAVTWVMNKQMRSGIQYLSDKIMILYKSYYF